MAHAQTPVFQDLFQYLALPKWNTSVLNSGTRLCVPDPAFSATSFFVKEGDNCTQHFVPNSPYSTQALAIEGITFTPTNPRVGFVFWVRDIWNLVPSGSWVLRVIFRFNTLTTPGIAVTLDAEGPAERGYPLPTPIDTMPPRVAMKATPTEFRWQAQPGVDYLFGTSDTTNFHTWEVSYDQPAQNISFYFDGAHSGAITSGAVQPFNTLIIGVPFMDGDTPTDDYLSSITMQEVSLYDTAVIPPPPPATRPPLPSAAPSPPPTTTINPCRGSAPAIGAVCDPSGSWITNTLNLTVTSGQEVVVNNSITLDPSDVTVIALQDGPFTVAPVTVNGDVMLDGALVLQLDDPLTSVNGTVVPIFTSSNMSGTFTTITVQGNRKCKALRGEQTGTVTSFSVLVYQDPDRDSCGSPKLSKGAIAGIVIGGLFGVALIVGILLYIFRIRKSGPAMKFGINRDPSEGKSVAKSRSGGVGKSTSGGEVASGSAVGKSKSGDVAGAKTRPRKGTL